MKLKSLIVATAIAAMAVAGCSSSSKSSSTETTVGGKSAVCAARSNLKASIAALTNPSVLTGGKDGIQSALDEVKSNLDAVSDAAQDTYKPQVDDVKSAVSDLQDAVGNFGSGSITDNVQAAGTAITKVGSTSASLISTLDEACS